LTGGNSLFWAATGNSNNGIQALQANGFQVGTDGSVNANGPTYHYLAFKNTGGGCSLPGPQTVQASADAWLDEAAPNSNFGPDTVLKVTSKGPSNDTRAVLKFNLPTIPSDCSVVGATLRLNNQSPVSGRAIEVLRIDPNDAAWTENGVDWTNQPATTGSAATATTPASAGWMQWDVTSQVQAMYSSTNGGFKVMDQIEDGAGFEQQFGSREAGTNRPELVVTVG
jgi:large repetitive protein